MIIKQIHVENYHSIENETLNCDNLTALVGKNGSGKSSFLHALNLFYALSPKIDTEDFYNHDISRELIISVTFTDISNEAQSLFSKYIQKDELVIQKVFSIKEGQIHSSYHGSKLQNPIFKEIRNAKASDAKPLYQALQKQTEYMTLPNWKNLNDGLLALNNWEENNVEACVIDRDDGQFFGFKPVAEGYLGRYTKFLFIPAVRDAAQDAVDGTKSPIGELMDLIVRNILSQKPELSELKKYVQEEFSNLMDPTKLTELDILANGMTQTLQQFVPEASIEMIWQTISYINFPLPKADTKLKQDGYSSPVNRAGHGLQRAFIITTLQHLALAQQTSNPSEESKNNLPVLILAIEEPELYQHPNSQHHFAKILLNIAKGVTPGVAEKTQIIYGTHSPHFVGIDRINQIRLLRKVNGFEGYPKITKIIETSLPDIATSLHTVTGSEAPMFTEQTLIPRLHSIMTRNLNEGFFADVVVLVEGEDDVAAIQGYAEALGHDLASQGISVIPCNGKSGLDRPSIIFQKFGIPTYIIWDADKTNTKNEPKSNKSSKENHTMFRLVGHSINEDYPITQVHNTYAFFEYNLETTLENEIGSDIFQSKLKEAQTKYSINGKNHALKNPNVISYIISEAKNLKKTSSTLESIINNIIKLKHNDCQDSPPDLTSPPTTPT